MALEQVLDSLHGSTLLKPFPHVTETSAADCTSELLTDDSEAALDQSPVLTLGKAEVLADQLAPVVPLDLGEGCLDGVES